ncbi:MAG TPA: SGNH/GDSL hydrolase family protein, partial [Clostridium sp.]
MSIPQIRQNKIDIATKANQIDLTAETNARLSDKADNASQSEKAGLSGWLRDLQFNRNKKICCVGDSTTDNTTAAMYLWNTIINSFTGSGDSLEGVALVNHGHNGNSLANYLASGTAEVINEQADMYIFSYGINDVRLGTSTQQQLIDMLDTAIQQLLKQTKGYILLRMPNSFLTDDVGAFGFVSPLASAQAYT